MSLVQENILSTDMFSQLQYLKTLFTKNMPNFCQIDFKIEVYLKVCCSFCIKVLLFVCKLLFIHLALPILSVLKAYFMI